jgi:hypothetical protein
MSFYYDITFLRVGTTVTIINTLCLFDGSNKVVFLLQEAFFGREPLDCFMEPDLAQDNSDSDDEDIADKTIQL